MEVYRPVAEANPTAFGHMVEVADALMPLMWMPQGTVEAAQEMLELVAQLNGITTDLARQLMVVFQRMARDLKEDPWRSEKMEPQALLHDANVVILLGQLERDFPRAVAAPAVLIAYRPGIANATSYAASLLTSWLSMQTGPQLQFHDLRGSPVQPAYFAFAGQHCPSGRGAVQL